MDNSLEERVLILILVIFSIFIVIYKPNYGDHYIPGVIEIVSDNRDHVIIK